MGKKMGPKEKEILKQAHWHGGYRLNNKDVKQAVKRLCEEKGWLERVDYGQFDITQEGRKALEERTDGDNSEAGLDDFS